MPILKQFFLRWEIVYLQCRNSGLSGSIVRVSHSNGDIKGYGAKDIPKIFQMSSVSMLAL
jgi:hypothetical protein